MRNSQVKFFQFLQPAAPRGYCGAVTANPNYVRPPLMHSFDSFRPPRHSVNPSSLRNRYTISANVRPLKMLIRVFHCDEAPL